MAIERFEFDEEIAVEPVEGRAESYAGSFGEGWRIGNGVNGGVIMSLATTALQARLDREGAHGELLAFSGYFLTPSGPGPVATSSLQHRRISSILYKCGVSW